MNLALIVEPTVRPSLPELLERLWKERHTGQVVLHYAQGFVATVEFPAEPQRVRLDNKKS